MFDILNKFHKSVRLKNFKPINLKSGKIIYPNGKKLEHYAGGGGGGREGVHGLNKNVYSNHTVIQVQAINSDLEKFHEKFGKYYSPDVDVIESESFFRAIGPVIRFGQIFTLMPIVNCLDKDLNAITFKWKSFQTYKSVFGIGCSFFEYFLFLWVIASISIQINLTIIGANAFFVTNCFGQVFLFRLSMNWRKFIKYWTERERIFLYPPYRSYKMCLKGKIRLAAFLMLGGACVEHLLYLVQVFYTNYKKIELCGYHQSLFELIYYRVKYHFYIIFSYNEFLLFATEWINLTMAISWTFIDVLIVTISIALITRFEQINDRVQMYHGKAVPEIFWIDVRTHYNKLIECINIVDKYFGAIIILSCSNSMYFICQQMYNSVKTEFTFDVNRIYFWLSFLFVFLRAMAVLFSAARINDVSVRSLGVMRNIPANSWSVEAARFTEQLSFQCVAVSAHNFFSITRRFLLGMAGTIITYEIVLLDQLELKSLDTFTFCDSF